MEMFLTIKLCTYANLNCFSIEQIIYIKMDLVLNNLQRLICHKTKQTKHHPLLPSLPGSLWPVVVAPDRVLSMGQKELNSVLMLN